MWYINTKASNTVRYNIGSVFNGCVTSYKTVLLTNHDIIMLSAISYKPSRECKYNRLIYTCIIVLR